MYILERISTSRDSGQPPFLRGIVVLRNTFLVREDHEQECAKQCSTPNDRQRKQPAIERHVLKSAPTGAALMLGGNHDFDLGDVRSSNGDSTPRPRGALSGQFYGLRLVIQIEKEEFRQSFTHALFRRL